MTKTMLAAVAALAMSPAMATAQTAPAAPQGVPVEAPLLAGATLSPSCGELFGLEGKAFCVTAPLPAIGDIAEAYITHFESQGWLAAAGDDNRVVFIKRRDGGGCDGMQVQAFYDPNRPTGPEVPGYIAMATIPGNVCRDETAAPASPAAPATPQ